MSEEQAIRARRAVNENAAEVHAFLAEMADWEKNARLEDESLLDKPHQQEDVPPIRCKSQKNKLNEKSKVTEKRINSSDYSAWEKYDADKACDELDKKEKLSTTSLDSKESEQEKIDKLRQEAQLEKEKGNKFVQEKKWNAAIECYNRAIELYKDDAIYYANRALCYLKKEMLHEAEADCTRALELDPKYIKALQRRSCAREGLGLLHGAATDLGEILKIEPQNVTVQKQLSSLIQQMGGKAQKLRSNPEEVTAKLAGEDKKFKTEKDDKWKPQSSHKDQKHNKKSKKKTNSNEMFVEPIYKPPHLRSKRPLDRIQIAEIPKGSTITAISLKSSANDFTKLVAKYINKKNPFKTRDELKKKKNYEDTSPRSEEKTKTNNTSKEKQNKKPDMNHVNQTSNVSLDNDLNGIKFSIPKSSVQFISDWRLLKNKKKHQSLYIKAIKPSNIPLIFKESLESDIFSDILSIICNSDDFNKGENQSFLYLKYLSEVKRFSTLVMFMSSDDKQAVIKILNRCKENGECAEDEMIQIKNKYEI